MKKIFLAAVLSVSFVYAQNSDTQKMVEAENCKTLEKAKADNEKATSDPKKGIKSSTWLKKAQTFEEIALTCMKADSNAGVLAYQAYKKALEVEPEGGKSGKDIKAGLAGVKLYSALMQQGAAAYNNKNIQNALSAFRLASEVNPKDTTSMIYAGIAAQQVKDIESAKTYYQKFVDAGGKDAAVYFSLASFYRGKDDAKAVAILKKGLEKNPGDKDLQGEIVNINISSGNADQAIAELKTLVNADPKNVQNLLNLAILLGNTDKKAESLETYKKVLALEPNNYDCNFNMGVVFFNEAIEIKKEVDKMDMKTYQKEGKAVEEKVCAKFNEAKPYFEKAKAVRSDDSQLVDNLTSLANVLEQCSKRK